MEYASHKIKRRVKVARPSGPALELISCIVEEQNERWDEITRPEMALDRVTEALEKRAAERAERLAKMFGGAA